MNCTVCQRNTEPIHIDGQNFCSNCGNAYQTAPPANTAIPAPKPPATPPRRSLDLGPRYTTAKPAAALHRRTASPHVIDLSSNHQTPKPAATSESAHPATPAPIAHEHTAPTAGVVHTHAGRIENGPAADTAVRIDPKAASRLTAAKQVNRSPAIGRFAGGRLPNSEPETPGVALGADLKYAPPGLVSRTMTSVTPPHANIAPAALPPHAAAQHAAMARLAPTPPAAVPPSAPAPTAAPKPKEGRPKLTVTAHHRRLATTAAAVVLMAGYVWLNNYPKLSLQTADAHAGISATMPGFLPSSYSLARTATSPGAITLEFKSPSAPQALTIAQQRTGWDASSLLDDYVAEAADDYATVSGQGLIIYLYGNNNATWVNHGIWYSIQGASQLSRDQILKIAYSL